MATITSEQVWALMAKQHFAVVGLVNAAGQGRTAGVVPAVHDGAVWFSSLSREWKIRHIEGAPDVSVTVPVRKTVPLMPWIPVPPATITFTAHATVHLAADVPAAVVEELNDGLDLGDGSRGESVVVELRPTGDFVTYGIGVSAMGMRDTEGARGRAPSVAA